MKIGVFDTGIGGEIVASSLRSNLPNIDITVINDRTHFPYGNKAHNEIITLTDKALQPLINGNYDVIVLACNTVTAVAIDALRLKYPNQKFIGIEPMIKTAARLTKSGIITVCATPATLASQRYKKLKTKFGQNLEIIEPDCCGWAQMVENKNINEPVITEVINNVCKKGSDVIILGCTHYHQLKDLIKKIADERAEIIEPSRAIARRIKTLLNLS